MADLNKFEQYFGAVPDNATPIMLSYALVVMNHNLWVQRTALASAVTVPNPGVPPTRPDTDPAIYGWPQKTTERGSARVPFMSDACFSGYGTPPDANVNDINITFANNSPLPAMKKSSGHVSGGSVSSISVNMVFADGHVESHNRQQIRCAYLNPSGPAGWFY